MLELEHVSTLFVLPNAIVAEGGREVRSTITAPSSGGTLPTVASPFSR
jgi:hypothetical protein